MSTGPDCFGFPIRLVTGLQGQKGQRTPAMQIAREAGPKLFLSFSPSEERFTFLRRPQITPEAFSMMGEAFTIRGISHGKSASRQSILKIRFGTLGCRTWAHRKTAVMLFSTDRSGPSQAYACSGCSGHLSFGSGSELRVCCFEITRSQNRRPPRWSGR